MKLNGNYKNNSLSRLEWKKKEKREKEKKKKEKEEEAKRMVVWSNSSIITVSRGEEG